MNAVIDENESVTRKGFSLLQSVAMFSSGRIYLTARKRSRVSYATRPQDTVQLIFTHETFYAQLSNVNRLGKWRKIGSASSSDITVMKLLCSDNYTHVCSTWGRFFVLFFQGKFSPKNVGEKIEFSAEKVLKNRFSKKFHGKKCTKNWPLVSFAKSNFKD
jgi:hypothetical protein